MKPHEKLKELHIVLDKVIEKAKNNGWKDSEGLMESDNFYIGSWEIVFFDPDFAKAFFGEQTHRITEIRNEVIGCEVCLCEGFPRDFRTKDCWQYHLQQMVLETNYLKYLEKFL